MKMSNDFDDYCNNTQCPLIAKVDWSKPMLSWFIMRYNGFIVKRGANEKPILSFAVNKDGYSFQSKKGVYIWKNSNYHDTGTFGLPGGYLLDAEGSTVATATGCSTNPLSSYNCVTYNLFNVESDANAYKIKLEIEMH